MFEKRRMFWKVRARPLFVTSWTFSPDIRSLFPPGGEMKMAPPVGRYSPVMQLKKVVLPAPLGPMRATMSPSFT